jgi:type I restriction enzyme, R subunit
MPPIVPYKKQIDVVTSQVREQDIETEFLTKLDDLKYTLRSDIRDRATMEQNFREKFEALNRVRLTDSEFARLRFLPIYQFADEANKKITHLDDFAATFLVKCTLGQTISRYMVLIASEQKLLMMRPYQVYAVKHIVTCIQQDSGNGYIWHTTGSGKTLTSFKASTLLKDNPDIEKCLFVVDRKDLDRQTREEFNRFQEGCVEENTNTGALVRRLVSEDYADKVIVTTIQKLGLALDENNKRNKQRKKNDQQTFKELLEPLRDKRMAFIFDECHRSQFGENHKAIKEFFPKAQLFGFTGTPIFVENASRVKIEDQQAS